MALPRDSPTNRPCDRRATPTTLTGPFLLLAALRQSMIHQSAILRSTIPLDTTHPRLFQLCNKPRPLLTQLRVSESQVQRRRKPVYEMAMAVRDWPEPLLLLPRLA
jgi:hypothetical protein